VKAVYPLPDHKSAESLAKSMAAHVSWANTMNRTARTANARRAADARFLEMAGGDKKRAESLRAAHYKRIQLKSIASRKAKKTARDKATKAAGDAETLDGGAA
jgi:hypothetical protein